MKILKLPEVIAKTGLSKSTIYAKAKAGTFPKPVKLGTRASGFIEEEINAFIAGRVLIRDTTPAAPLPVSRGRRKPNDGRKGTRNKSAVRRVPKPGETALSDAQAAGVVAK